MDQILIVEDDNIDRKLLETYVNGMGYSVISTQNGSEAWDLIDKGAISPQIAIIDWLMPEMDGIALCRKIREKQRSNYIYIILVTAKNMSQDIVFGLEAGADDYLTKPYDKAELIARIHVGSRIVKLEQEKNEQLRKISDSNLRLRQNMEAAAQTQMSLLPKKNLVFNNYEFNWYFQPSEHLAGDMLHIYRLTESKIACYVLDVSGHGTEAALLSVAVRNQLTASLYIKTEQDSSRDFVYSEDGPETSPKEIIRELAQFYKELLNGTGQYFTIVFGVLDTKKRIFSYVCAGHFDPIFLSQAEVIEIQKKGGPPIGMFENQKYTQQELRLSPADRLYLFTDGVIEARNKAGEQFGLDRLKDRIIMTTNHEKPLDYVIKDLKNWTEQTEFDDDIAMIEINCPKAID